MGEEAVTEALAVCCFTVVVREDGVPVLCNRVDFTAEAAELVSSRVETFCFPEYKPGVHPIAREAVPRTQRYTFALTRADGRRVHGFCRRSARPACHPQVACVLTHLPWFAFFTQALDVVAQLLPAADATHPWLDATSPAATVLKSLLMGRLPPAGSHVRLTVPASVAESQTAWFAVPPDRGTGARHSPHNTDTHMAPLLHAIPPEAVVAVVASLLHERRLVFTGSHPGLLSSVVYAAATLLYPLSWQHIFLPILPAGMLDYLTAPMPFIIGVPAALAASLQSLPMEEVVVVDLDTGVCQFFQADVAALPHTPLKSLRRQLAAAVALTHTPAHPADVPYLAQQEGAIRDAMLRFFVHVLGAYSRHVRPTVREGAAGETLSAAGLMLDQDSFVAARVTSQRSRAFLGAMRQTQMYEVWVRERLELLAAGGTDRFEEEARLHESQSSQRVKLQLESGLQSMRSEMKALNASMARGLSSTWSSVKEGTQQLAIPTSPGGTSLQDMRERAATLGASLRDRAERVQQRASNHLATLTSSRAPTASTPAPPATLHAHTRSSSSSETLHAHTRSSSSCGELPEEPPHRAESESSDEEDSPPVSPAARVVPKVSIGPLLGATPTQTPVAARAVPRLQPPPLSSQGLPASPAVGSFAPSATPPLEEEAVAVDLWSDFTAAASPAGEPGDLLATALGLGELLQPDSSASLI